MKATKFDLKGTRHPALKVYHEIAYKKLIFSECELVDGDLVEDGETPFKNNEKTLVVALPDFSDSSNKDNQHIWDWINDFVDDFFGCCCWNES
jgi:hypothetical protein